jgi:signal transduction histidine kinase/putative methionine-R-sulfoxide reductase with GAF domain
MSRISLLQHSATIDETTPFRRAFRIAAILLGITVIVEVATLSLAFLLDAWQMYALAAVIFAFGISLTIGLVATRRGSSKTGVWLIIGGLFVIFPAASALLANLGVLFALSQVFVLGVIISQTLPTRQAIWTLIAAFGVSAITFLLNRLGLDYRLSVPQLQAFIPVMAASLVIICIIFIARHFTGYSLRVKFVIIFLILSLFSVGVVAFVANNSISTNLTQNAGDNLNNLAELQALSIGELLVRQIGVLESLSIDSQFWGRFKTANAKYGSDPAQILTAIHDLEQRWDTATEADRLVSDTLFNIEAIELLALRKIFPAHVQIFVTDKHGGVLAATDRTPDYYHANEEWWQHAYNNGQGEVYISQPTFDQSSATFGLIIALPIYDPDQNVIGIAHSIYSLNELKSLIRAGGSETQSIQSVLLLSNKQILSVDDDELESLDSETLAQLEASSNELYGEFDFEGLPSFVGQASVIDFTGEPAIANLDWTYITYQQREAALSVVDTQVRNVIGWGILVAVIAVLVAIFAAQQLANPIIRLTAIAQQMTSGDLTVQAQVESGDEVGDLAQSFNTMANQLRETIETLEDQVRERTQHLETVAILSGHINAVLDMKQLLNELANRVKEDFNYYAAHIYLLDEAGQNLVLAEGAGAVGAKMKAAGHRIALAVPTSLKARAARSREVVMVENVQEVEDWLPHPLLPDTRSEMAVPIIREGKVIGVLDVQADTIAGLDDGDAKVLRILAGHIAVAISNARLFDKTQKRLREQIILRETTDILSSTLDIETILLHLTKQLCTAIDATSAYINEIDEKQGVYTVIAEYISPNACDEEKVSDLGESYPMSSEPLGGNSPMDESQWLRELQQGLHEVDHIDDPNLSKSNFEEMEQFGAKSILFIPLKIRGKLIGYSELWESRHKREFTSEEIDLCILISRQGTSAIENARLFEQTQQATERAETSRAEAEMANLAKSSFLSNMSHELRTPLNAIINFVEMIALGMAGPINDQQKDLLNQSVNSSTHLLSLINDVLDISKIQSGHLKLFLEGDVNLYDELATAIEMATPLINEKPIQIIKAIDNNLPIIVGDKRRIRQVLLNLLTNAIKFTDEGSITVKAKCQVDRVTFAVIDTGPGIAKEAQSAIFEPFVQTVDGIKFEQGTGLGLSISYNLALSHGGDLWVESEPGQGATFYFTLPTMESLKNNGE